MKKLSKTHILEIIEHIIIWISILLNWIGIIIKCHALIYSLPLVFIALFYAINTKLKYRGDIIVLFGFLFSLAGDILLMDGNLFLIGVGAFGLAHVCYILSNLICIFHFLLFN